MNGKRILKAFDYAWERIYDNLFQDVKLFFFLMVLIAVYRFTLIVLML